MITLFMGGLLGSVTHCVGMCGPFAFAQTASSRSQATVFGRLKNVALLPYHLGRIITYAVLGALVASFTSLFADKALFTIAAAVMMGTAAILFLASAVSIRSFGLDSATSGVGRIGTTLGQIARPFFAGQSPVHRFALGLVLGFLPCGLVGAALFAAAASGDPFTGFFAMASFGLATIPALTFGAALGQFFARKWSANIRVIAQGAMAFNGLSLLAIAGGLLS
ncbi:MAG: sulfite exporter TauE/SafE family protein [Kordiimonadaceae bacterium]|nr:sulfite exporter TauE/SafE family protein [Kordiimonadaceae bacterium]MBO6567450.1 sulfite exporter TauE/SafE family protein [Kordiimonadaceae bacterium]MBO6963336.1 sulfite exporter TauE/SafE family protein [Kordiimonadaceae bacterium]